jgi:hypothetical protein
MYFIFFLKKGKKRKGGSSHPNLIGMGVVRPPQAAKWGWLELRRNHPQILWGRLDHPHLAKGVAQPTPNSLTTLFFFLKKKIMAFWELTCIYGLIFVPKKMHVRLM